jgi:fructose-1-phosphate kinase PfkB-like protein
VNTIDEAKEKAAAFAQHGVANVMISLGEQGAMLLAGGKCYTAKPPVIHAVSTIGAGDSTIAGFIGAAGRGADAAECLKTAVSFGTAACLTEGSQPPLKADVARIFAQIELV